uniref:Uncharacterized protein n=1 Tax=viral metagenome TaxID=1070528 RepID=A0A6M3IG12_9ZZZZ
MSDEQEKVEIKISSSYPKSWRLFQKIARIKKRDPLGWWWECRKLAITETWWKFRRWITNDPINRDKEE